MAATSSWLESRCNTATSCLRLVHVLVVLRPSLKELQILSVPDLPANNKRFGDTLPKQLARNAVRSKLFLNGSQEWRSTPLKMLYIG